MMIVSMLLLVGCTKEDAVPANGKDEAEKIDIHQIASQQKTESQFKELQEKVDELQEEVAFLKSSQAESDHHQYFEIMTASHLLNFLPDIKVKLGYIEQMEESGEIEIKLVDFVHDESAPNNYRIDDLNTTESYSLNEEALFITLEGVTPQEVTREEFQEQISTHPRFMKLHLINEEIVLAAEQYLP